MLHRQGQRMWMRVRVVVQGRWCAMSAIIIHELRTTLGQLHIRNEVLHAVRTGRIAPGRRITSAPLVGGTVSGRGRRTLQTQRVGHRRIEGIDSFLIVLLGYGVLKLRDLIANIADAVVIIDVGAGAVFVLLVRMDGWVEEIWLVVLQMLLGHLVQGGQTVVAFQGISTGLEEGQQEGHVLGQVVRLVLRFRSGLLLYVAGQAGAQVPPSLLAVYY